MLHVSWLLRSQESTPTDAQRLLRQAMPGAVLWHRNWTKLGGVFVFQLYILLPYACGNDLTFQTTISSMANIYWSSLVKHGFEMFVLIFFADGIFHQSLHRFSGMSNLAEWEFEKKMVNLQSKGFSFERMDSLSRWWNFKYFLFSPLKLGKIPILTNIFQLGWNHQLVMDIFCLVRFLLAGDTYWRLVNCW